MSFHVYRSSAGSGKTHTLVREYLGIVLQRPSAFRNILAITFTNKAANEMRERILQSLEEIAEPHIHPQGDAVRHMLPELEEKTGLSAKTLSEHAAAVLTDILHNYQDFAVSTIDSFVYKIVRTFAFDLYLPLNFEVEVDEDTAVSQAVDILMARAGIDKTTTKALAGFTESRISEEKNWNIERELKIFSRRLLKDDVAAFLPSLREMDTRDVLKAARSMHAYCRSFEDGVQQHAAAVMAFWEEKGIGSADLHYGNSGIYGYVNKLMNRNFDKIAPSRRTMDTLGEDKWYKEALERSRKELIDRNKDEMIRLMSKLIDHIEKGLGKYELYSILKRNIYPLAVLNEILQVMQQIMESEGSIHISELDKRIARVVNEEPVPFIYERLGEKYKHFLIDEFQDTSVLEWQNLLPLVENSLAEAHMSMLVGDAKQAIYRFKGGEVEQLVRFPEIFGKPDTPEMDMREKSLERNFNEHDLPYNYRSREAIVNFNNAFYAFCAGLLPDHLKTIYEADPQKMKKKKPGGEVFIRFLESNTESGEKEQAYLDEIKRSIHDLIERKGYRWRDIAILCRGNAEASRIARHLMVSGIDVVSAESLLLSSSREVNLIVHCLDHLAGEHNKVAILGILSYVFADDTGALNKYAADCISGADNKEPEQKLEDILLQQGLAYDPPALKRMGLYERVEALIRIFSLGREADPYLVFFLDAVHDYERNRKNDPEGFTSHWRDKRHNYSIKVPEEMDAVRVLTIHKAKGLGFPVVIYPFANEKVRIRDDRSWVALSEEDLPELKVGLVNINRRLEQSAFAGVFQREMHLKQLDLLNLLYVATTRPRERLFILCDRPAKASEQADNIPGLLRAWLEDSGRWQEDQDSYRFGSSETLESSTKEHVPSIRLKSHVSTNWRDSIRLSGHASRYWDLDDESRNLEWGNLIHGILSKIDTVDDLPRAVYEEVNRGSLPEAKAMETEQKLKKILESEDLRRFFDGNYKLKNEVTIMRPGGQEYRPDRLMIRNRHAVIIDYKTGSEDDKHVRQIRQYAELLREIGYEKTEGYLLYLGDDFHLKMV